MSVRLSVLWQSELLVVTGLLLGIPLGLYVGLAVWRRLIQSLGVVDDQSLDALQLVLLVPIGIVVALLVGIVPAWLAARRRVAAAIQPA
jgi:ABC-type lipoprotein release transport system permease subunit